MEALCQEWERPSRNEKGILNEIDPIPAIAIEEFSQLKAPRCPSAPWSRTASSGPFRPSQLGPVDRGSRRNRYPVGIFVTCRARPLKRAPGGWMGRGARALDNPRIATGEESVGKLYALLEDLQTNGVQSPSYKKLKGKVFQRIDPDMSA
ncbi:unnamed protein product [Dovyalis caffra]|uniref:DUF8018 domain-containing protein n=1 Tax=Dovyalis caffra TaxID=77055 RepID=A0AAV1QNA8_9ROSI|nr:unnamed protein product [Dovyalis caffra]